jgi:hypothetical protein
MTILLNRYLNKISSSGILRSPADGSNAGGSGTQTGGEGGDDSQNDGTGDDQNGDDGDDDSDIPDLLDDEDKDDTGFKFDAEDDGDDLSDPEHPNNKAGAVLGNTLKSQIQNFKFSESDIPEDLDLTSRSSLAKFMTGVQQRSLAQSIELVAPVINHAMQTAMQLMEKRISQTTQGSAKQREIEEAFNSLGIKDKQDRSLARQLYQRGLDQKLKPKDAAKAVQKALAGLGRKIPAGNRNNDGGSATGIRVGKDALDAFFK